jgi:hypothetical protein
MVGIDGALGKSSPFQVHRSFAMLVSRLINHPADSLADRRWSLARCDAGYSVAMQFGYSAIAAFGGWCDSVRFDEATLERRFGEAISVMRKRGSNENSR